MDSITVVEQEVVVIGANGLHLVPCSRIVEAVRRFDGEVRLRSEQGRSADCKAIFELMGLGAEQGTRLVIEARGRMAPEIVDRLVRMFESGFEAAD